MPYNKDKEFNFETEFAKFKGEKDPDPRPLQLCRPCPCGCDTRGGVKGVGYITGGTDDAFATVWIQHEETYKALAEVFQAHDLLVQDESNLAHT